VNVPLETLLPVIDLLVARGVITLGASDVVDDLELASRRGPFPASRVRQASIA
jgi:hypothetical protein